MTTPGDPRTGRRWLALVAHILRRDTPLGQTSPICWRCGRPGADTAGHVLPIKTHRHLALDPDNLRAEHGTRRTIADDGYDCIGNYAAGADAGLGIEGASSRDWFAASTEGDGLHQHDDDPR